MSETWWYTQPFHSIGDTGSISCRQIVAAGARTKKYGAGRPSNTHKLAKEKNRSSSREGNRVFPKTSRSNTVPSELHKKAKLRSQNSCGGEQSFAGNFNTPKTIPNEKNVATGNQGPWNGKKTENQVKYKIVLGQGYENNRS